MTKQINIIQLVLLSFLGISHAFGQTGVNTNTPESSALLEVNSTNKGVLFPKVNVPDLLNSTPIITAPEDGLMVFNTDNNSKKTILLWDENANSSQGAWSEHLYFKETPKTAVISLVGNDFPALDGLGAGQNTYIAGDETEIKFEIITSGNLPSLEVFKDDVDTDIVSVGTGVYIVEVSFIINAPPPAPSRGGPLQGSYYNMGYLLDIYTFEEISNSYLLDRVERSVLSPLNENHRVTFTKTYDFTEITTQNLFELSFALGRRSGSTHNDLVYIIPEGSYIKLTKLK